MTTRPRYKDLYGKAKREAEEMARLYLGIRDEKLALENRLKDAREALALASHDPTEAERKSRSELSRSQARCKALASHYEELRLAADAALGEWDGILREHGTEKDGWLALSMIRPEDAVSVRQHGERLRGRLAEASDLLYGKGGRP